MEKNKKVENNTLYTRCPTCTTAFKVTEKLLNAAAGKVRCGACLAIFQATDYMLKPSERNKKPEIAKPEQTEQAVTQASSDDESSHSVSVESDNSQPTSAPQAENTGTETLPSEPLTKSDEYESEPEFEPPSQSTEQFDFETEPEFQIQTPLEPSPDSPVFPEQEELGLSESTADPEINLDEFTDDEHDFLSTAENEQDIASDAEEAVGDVGKISDFDYKAHSHEFDDEPAEFDQVVEQEKPDTQPDSNIDDEQTSYQRTEPSLGEADDIDLLDDNLGSELSETVEQSNDVLTSVQTDHDLDNVDQSEQLESVQEINTDVQTHQADDFEDDDLSGQLAEQMQDTDAEPDPLDEFENIVEEKNTDLRRNIILAVVGILVFIGLQQIWSNRQTLAWSESWGGTIKSVCQYLPCELKARRDVSKIRLLQRQLSPDEENENQLDVKVLLTNEASFDQPYPTIKIAFSNKNGEQVSVKSFPPEDYLEPDSLNKLMPHGTEVHIHFKTELTHPDALGFEFIFE
jgi:predicted Zn finger-like uncharacterized protein